MVGITFRGRSIGNADAMPEATYTDRIDDVAAGDVIALKDGEPAQRVVHIDPTDVGFLVTLEPEGGEIIQVELAAGATVTRTLGSKWESPQSPTRNSG